MEDELMRVTDKLRPGKCSDWHACHDRKPPSPETLKVTGKCEVPQSNYEVKLRRAEQQGTNPKDLLLELIVATGVADGWAVDELGEPLVTTRGARYEEKTDVKYETVTILPDGVTVRVDDVC